MSKAICSDAMLGAKDVVSSASAMLAKTIEAKGADHPVGFPDTAYYLPVIHSFTGRKVEKLSDLVAVLQDCNELLPSPPSDDVWLPYLGDALDAGAATLFAFETVEACKTLVGPDPAQGIWLGAANDVIMRERGVEFVDGTAPGFAAVIGAAPDSKTAVEIARELQEKNLYVFMSGSVNGSNFAEQLESEGVQLGWETRLVPFGKDVSSVIYSLGFANRAALSFGGEAAGDFDRNLKYNQERIFAFVLALGEVDQEKYAAAFGAINYGFPTIADTDIPEILPTGVCTYEHVVSNVPHDRMVEKALEVRGCKVRVTKVPIPAAYGAAFEGERIRKKDVQVEFGGNITRAFEFVTGVELEDIEDGEIEVVGKDLDEVEQGGALPLAIWVEVAGRKMQPDFEPILERQIHHLINGAEGIWHMGQRDIVWIRVSKAAYAKGVRLRDYGEIIHAKFLNEYPAIVDKVKVTLITEEVEVERRLDHARKIYVERNHRLASMTDDSVDTFYSCLLCQSFAPDHVCVITPERLGLCGAYNWLDGKAAYEIDETGPNQPVEKGVCLDPVRGVWEGVNEYVYKNSHKTISSITAYSLMTNPMTSCGCFEVIVAYVPECNGVMAVNREFLEDTPVGMTFSALAGMAGGGVQTPGFMGVGKAFLTSRKFLFAEGGLQRIVWMPTELKQMLGEDLQARFAEDGLSDLFDRIADESVATDPVAICEYMEKVGHPALQLEDMAQMSEASPGEGAPQVVKAPAEPVSTLEPQAKANEAVTPPAADDFSKERAFAEAASQPALGCVGPMTPAEAQMSTAKPAAVQPVAALAPPNLDNGGEGDPVSTLFQQFAASLAEQLKGMVATELASDLKSRLRTELSAELKAELKAQPLAEAPSDVVEVSAPVAAEPAPAQIPEMSVKADDGLVPSAAEKFAAVPLPREEPGETIELVRLGATEADGGTRRSTVLLGGQNCLQFHHFEGTIPNNPAYALEVFDSVSERTSPVLREIWGDVLERPADMAKRCVEVYGADAISVRLEGTHPEKGGKSPEEALELVTVVLAAVDVPVIVTGHSHFEATNEAMKKVAAGCQGERLLLNWLEGDNYRTIAGLALAYDHCVVAQTPIDVNLAKQLNILLANMDLPRDRIVMDPMIGALGYGLEYGFSVMERIRLTGFGGDTALTFPMIASVGQEVWKTKECNALETDFPDWGELAKRAVLWEAQTAMALIMAGADLVVLNHPEALAALRRNVMKLAAHGGLSSGEN